MNSNQYENYLRMLGNLLHQQNITGEILLAEKAMLLLDVQQREVSKKVDDYFGPGKAILEAAQIVSQRESLPSYWLNQALEVCFPKRAPSDGATYPGLHIYVAPPGYLLTMFILFGNPIDKAIMKAIAKKLNIFTVEDMLSFIKTYLPEQDLPSQIQDKIEQTFAA